MINSCSFTFVLDTNLGHKSSTLPPYPEKKPGQTGSSEARRMEGMTGPPWLDPWENYSLRPPSSGQPANYKPSDHRTTNIQTDPTESIGTVLNSDSSTLINILTSVDPITERKPPLATFLTYGNDVTRSATWDYEDNTFNIPTVFNQNGTSCNSNVVGIGHLVYLYGVAFLVAISILLNGLALAVFRTRGLRRFPFAAYLTAIAFADTISLCSHIPRKWVNVLYIVLGWGEGTTFYDNNTVTCKLLTYFAYVARFLSSWLVVALGSERLRVASGPYRRSRYPTLKSAKQGLLYSGIASILCNAHVLFVWDSYKLPGDDHFSCVPATRSSSISLGLTIGTVVMIVGVPFLIVCGMITIVARNFGSWNVRPRRLNTSVVARALFEKEVTIMVVVVSVTFCLLCMPYLTAWIILLAQHFKTDVPLCRYIDIAAGRDMAEVGFMIIYAIKFLMCIFSGRGVLSRR